MSDIYFNIFSRRLKLFTLLDTERNRSNSVIRLSLAANWIPMSEDDLESKFIYVQIWGRECWRARNAKIILFSSQSIDNLKLYNISKNQPSRSVEGGGGMRFPLFDLEKRTLLPLSPLQIWLGGLNLVCRFQMCFLMVSALQLLCAPFKLQKCSFLLFFSPDDQNILSCWIPTKIAGIRPIGSVP